MSAFLNLLLLRNHLPLPYLISGILLLHSCTPKPGPESYDPEGSTITTDKVVNYQVRRTWRWNNGDLSISNEFAGARLSDVIQMNRTSFDLIIEPENEPINNSAWYGFSIQNKGEETVLLTLHYFDDYGHRYYPDVSTDLIHWKLMDSSLYATDTILHTATLQIPPSQDTLYIASQPVHPSSSTYAYTNALSKVASVEKNIYGYSTLGKPMEVLQFGKGNSGKAIVIFGRQHPPEVTGYLALQAFVERLISEDPVAFNFREQYEVLLFPMLNPDGVDQGHWRHNASGIDLNRDWYDFNQPETRAVKEYIESYVANSGNEITFFIDFHSTQEDLFYVFDKDRTSNFTGLTHQWLDSIDNNVSDYTADRVPTSGNSPVSTRYFYETYETEAVTYEVGDHSSESRIKEISSAAGESLMKILSSGN